MQFLLNKKEFFVSLVVVYVFLIADYFFTSLGISPSTLFLQMRRYIPCAVSVAIAITVWKSLGLSTRHCCLILLLGLRGR